MTVWACAQAHTVILDADPQPLAFAMREHAHVATLANWRKSVANRVLEQRLQQQRRNGFAARRVPARELHAQPVAKTNLLDLQVVTREVQLFVERGEVAGVF